MSALRQATWDAWREQIPDWVAELDRRCALSSQNRVAKKLSVSAAMISNVLGNKYTGDMARVEDLVRGHFMNGTIACPALGEIPTNVCRAWQGKSRDFGSANSQRVMMFRACSQCPRNQREGSS